MPPSPPPRTLAFSTALITGGGGGLGFALAQYSMSLSEKVIIVGRTESNLRSASTSLNNCPYYLLNTGAVTSLPLFVSRVTADHPDLDCLINNVGVQRLLHVDDRGEGRWDL